MLAIVMVLLLPRLRIAENTDEISCDNITETTMDGGFSYDAVKG